MSKTSSPNPEPFQTDVQLWLCGRWGEKGIAIVHDGQNEVRFELAPGQFDLLAILVRAAIKPASPGQSWVPSGFITAVELCEELTRIAGREPNRPVCDYRGVIRMIYRLRESLAEKMVPEGEGGRDWADRFLESGPLGYRLSSPPANLRLAILTALKEPRA
jgi:hypothetical protein